MYKILHREQLTENIVLMDIETPWIAQSGKPGQFVIVIPHDKGERVPLTICDIDKERDSVTIVFQIVGESTQRLAALNEGDSIFTIVGPLGNKGEIMDSASSELASIRLSIRRSEHDIAQAANRFVASHSDSVVDGIITYRSGRAMILVRASEKNQFGGLVYGDSASGQASYIEPAQLVTLNNRRQEYLNREQQEIERILDMCSKEVSKVAREELANLETCTILDTVFSKASWGAANDACAPELTETKEMHLI